MQVPNIIAYTFLSQPSVYSAVLYRSRLPHCNMVDMGNLPAMSSLDCLVDEDTLLQSPILLGYEGDAEYEPVSPDVLKDSPVGTPVKALVVVPETPPPPPYKMEVDTDLYDPGEEDEYGKLGVVPASPSPPRVYEDTHGILAMGSCGARRRLFGDIPDEWLYRPPPLNLPMTQPAPEDFENDGDTTCMSCCEGDALDDGGWTLPDANPDKDTQTALGYDSGVDNVLIREAYWNLSKDSKVKNVHGLTGPILSLLKEEHRCKMMDMRNRERLERHCLALGLKGASKRLGIPMRKAAVKRTREDMEATKSTGSDNGASPESGSVNNDPAEEDSAMAE